MTEKILSSIIINSRVEIKYELLMIEREIKEWDFEGNLYKKKVVIVTENVYFSLTITGE
jgi:hypothetical protein